MSEMTAQAPRKAENARERLEANTCRLETLVDRLRDIVYRVGNPVEEDTSSASSEQIEVRTIHDLAGEQNRQLNRLEHRVSQLDNMI